MQNLHEPNGVVKIELSMVAQGRYAGSFDCRSKGGAYAKFCTMVDGTSGNALASKCGMPTYGRVG